MTTGETAGVVAQTRAIPAKRRGRESRVFDSHPFPEVRMNCQSCKKEIVPDSVFRRWVALALDPLIAVVLYLLGVGIVGSISKDLEGEPACR